PLLASNLTSSTSKLPNRSVDGSSTNRGKDPQSRGTLKMRYTVNSIHLGASKLVILLLATCLSLAACSSSNGGSLAATSQIGPAGGQVGVASGALAGTSVSVPPGAVPA